jgi:hypothetical protein
MDTFPSTAHAAGPVLLRGRQPQPARANFDKNFGKFLFMHCYLGGAARASTVLTFKFRFFAIASPGDLTHVRASASQRAAVERKTLVKSFFNSLTFSALLLCCLYWVSLPFPAT